MGTPTTNNRPVMYRTVEEDYNNLYASELRTMKMLTVFSIISLCLSIMGIFALVPLVVSLITAGLIAVQVYLTTRQNPAEAVKAE